MKKIYAYLIIALLLAAVAMAVPAWKKPTTPTSPVPTKKTQPAQTVIVQNVTQIIVQNESALPEKGIDWNLIGGVATVIALAAGAIGWWLSRRQRGMTAQYMREIDKTFHSYKDNSSKCESELYSIKEKIDRDFAHGKVNENAYTILDARLDKYLSEIRKGIVGSEFKLSKESRKEFDQMLEDGVITEDEYRKFSRMKLSELSPHEKQKLKHLMSRWKSKKR